MYLTSGNYWIGNKLRCMQEMDVQPSGCLDVGDREARTSRLGGREGGADDDRYGWSMA